jgi:hypothetical protein
MEVESTDWQSLTFSGERHRMCLRAPGGDGRAIAERLCSGIEEHEFSIPNVIVADIHALGNVEVAADGSATVTIEALTVAAD